LHHSVGSALIEAGRISQGQWREALALHESSGRSLSRCLTDLDFVDERSQCEVLAHLLKLPLFFIDGSEIESSVISSVPVEIAQQYKCVPVSREGDTLTLALSDPSRTEALDDVQFVTGCRVRPVLSPESEILRAIEKYYDVTVEKILEDLTADGNGEVASEEYFIHDLQEKASEPTLINLVNLIISQAIHDGASDIHIEPFEREMKVKYRVDGILHEIAPPPKNLQPAIVSRVKIMAGMDIAKRHVPQDGHIRINLPDAKVDIRVNTVPTIFGESLVLRLLNKTATQISLEELGFSANTYRRYKLLLDRTYGIVLVCGPTGCGKTTTLYASLCKIYTPEKKIITIEDPVEYQLTGINQIPVREGRGVSFATGLRAILRQDPDILMVGEIRDLETAEIAIRGALTGHLIFSTLHTNDAASAVTRLLDMGVESFLIASSLQGVVAQRLVRRLCRKCREPVRPDPVLLAQFDRTKADIDDFTFYRAAGCDACKGRGYSGRVALAELLLMSEKLQQAILNREPSHAIKALARATMRTIREEGWDKICQGVTSFEDVLRQTQRDEVEEE